MHSFPIRLPEFWQERTWKRSMSGGLSIAEKS